MGPRSPRVYWRRRIVLAAALVGLLLFIVLVVVRPGASQGEPSGDEAERAAVSSSNTPSPAAPAAATTPPAPTPTPGGPCDPAMVTVEAITDAESYGADDTPKLSLSVTNGGPVACTVNAGTSTQVFTITSGDDTYWTSTDCQTDPADALITLEPGETVESSAPIEWSRQYSSPDTCDSAEREAVPAGGASYHLDVTVDGIASSDTSQFILE